MLSPWCIYDELTAFFGHKYGTIVAAAMVGCLFAATVVAVKHSEKNR